MFTEAQAMLVPSVLALLVASCSSGSSSTTCGPDSIASTARDVTSATESEAGFSLAVTDSIPTGLLQSADAGLGGSPAEEAADAVASAVGQYFSPSSCAAATRNVNVVTIQLSGCSGPLGLSAANGTISATITVDIHGLHVEVDGNVTVGSAKLQLKSNGTASISADLRTKTLQIESSGGGTGPLGNNVAHTGSYTLSWEGGGTGCATIDGTFTGVGSRSDTASIVIAGYKRCSGQCPQAGTVTSTFPGGSLSVVYNGTSTAQCTSSAGGMQAFTLACQ
jgi:hypothetical protein